MILHLNFQSSIPKKTLMSIYSLEIQRRTKYQHFILSQPGTIQAMYNRYVAAIKNNEEPGILLRISAEAKLPPTVVARRILEQYLLTVTNASKAVIKATVSANLKNSSLIQDRDLALEVYLCVLNDDCYGPIADVLKMTIGLEYEVLLKKRLAENNIPFSDEHKLRHQGFDKTPDVKLDIPIGVDGRVINWIESKALFADEKLHQQYLKDQLWPYWNRFGPGMVIYWFGYELSIRKNTSSSNAARILVRHDFPEKCLVLTPDLILNKR
ncbi:CDAN1-interacting nuclease 1-like isoform X2 [Artemia franciscana]|uniref:CDAN1-interacting nuclease 1-like isoform X2 n=1 Tax=Artemia franciscana TaxID=6661 RepID=UPI0032DBD5A7